MSDFNELVARRQRELINVELRRLGISRSADADTSSRSVDISVSSSVGRGDSVSNAEIFSTVETVFIYKVSTLFFCFL